MGKCTCAYEIEVQMKETVITKRKNFKRLTSEYFFELQKHVFDANFKAVLNIELNFANLYNLVMHVHF